MKREFLQNLDLGDGARLSAAAIDSIMAEHGRSYQTLQTERDGYKSQLETAQKTIKSYEDMDIDGIKNAAKNWEEKYAADTKALQDQLAGVKYGHAVDKIVDGLKFSSTAAKKAYRAELVEKGLQQQEDGSLLGYKDWHEAYVKNDPSAFVADNPAPSYSVGGGGTGGGRDPVAEKYKNNPFYR